MPNRILKETICTSETVNDLSPELEVFFYRLLVQCDDFGRFDARPSIIRSRCYPLRLEKITEKMIIEWLNVLSATGLIQLYEHEGKQYLLITTWDKHQQMRAKRSKYPEPTIICNHLQSSDSTCHRNPIQSNPNPIRESESESSEPSVSEESLRLSNLLKTLMLTNDPGAKLPSDIKKWAIEIDRINRIDKRSFEEIEAIIKYSQQDKFWKTNILSAGKLRDKIQHCLFANEKQRRQF